MEQFGTNPGPEEPRERPGAYGIALTGEQVLLVQWAGHFYLPGGGLEHGERPEEALRREVLEETGFEVFRTVPACTARQYGMHEPSNAFVNKVCSFFRIILGPQTGHPARDHLPRWVDIPEAEVLLREEASWWAIQQVTR
ncbi:MAG: NUDIX domain-containing protein [Actinomycetota bacterium]